MLTNNIEAANAITHAGVFHADDVFSAVLLKKLHPDWQICRVVELPELLSEERLIFDIGGGSFDHHQSGFDRHRSNGIKFSSFGLLWQEFGMQLLKQMGISSPNDVFEAFDRFVSSIDAYDNGQWLEADIPVISTSQLISSFNPHWNELQDFDTAFEKATMFATTIFENMLRRCIAETDALQIAQKACQQAENGIMVLPRYVPWRGCLQHSSTDGRILYVIYPTFRGGFAVQCVGTDSKNLFPAPWAGCDKKVLVWLTGIESVSFCHPGRFLCCTDTLEDAIALAKRAIAYNKTGSNDEKS